MLQLAMMITHLEILILMDQVETTITTTTTRAVVANDCTMDFSMAIEKVMTS